MTPAELDRLASEIARTLAVETGNLVDRRLDQRVEVLRGFIREAVRAELDARLPPPNAAADAKERRMQ